MKEHDHPHRVTYAETDRMGFAYYGNYLTWFEIGRTEMIRASGMAYRELEDRGYMLPVTEAACRYHAPARYDDLVTIHTTLTEFKGIRMTFGYEILLDGIVLAEGVTKHAFTDRDGKPVKIGKDVKAMILGE